MDSKKRPSFTELRVGIFVLISCIILAVAIFTIGTQVGILEKTFYAKTYLNNVAGLKPGDIVLLAGVEIGNVIEVRISSPDQLPPTVTNQRTLAEIERLEAEINRIQGTLEDQRRQLSNLRQELEQRRQRGIDAALLQSRIQALEERIRQQERNLEELRSDQQAAREKLQNIEVYMQLRDDEQTRTWIRRDSSISLGSIGLLGDKYVEISLGRSADPPVVERWRKETFFGLSSEDREVVLITGTTQPGFEELITGAGDVLANLETLSKKLESIMEGLVEGRGTVGKFITDPTFYNNLNNTVLSARQTIDRAYSLLQDIKEGEGTLARLINDPALYDRIESAGTRLEKVLERIEQGEGSLGRFVNDPSFYENTDRMAANLSEITERMRAGHGTLGKLSTDDRVYSDLQRSLDKLASLLEEVEQGKGTLGRLAKDEQLYQNINTLSSEMVKLLYDFRQNPKKFLTIKFEIF